MAETCKSAESAYTGSIEIELASWPVALCQAAKSTRLPPEYAKFVPVE